MADNINRHAIISERLKECRLTAGLTQEQVGEICGVKKSTVGRWENGKVANVKLQIFQTLSNYYGVNPSWLSGFDAPKKRDSNGKSVLIPVLGSIAAGIPLEAIQDIIDYEEIPRSMAKTGDFFALLVKGDSMSPRITDGDVVIVRKQETAENGDVVAVLINGENATLKRFYRTENGIKLIPNNHNYEPLFFTPEEVNNLPVVVLGKVVELRAKF